MGIEALEGTGLIVCRAINLSSFARNMLADMEDACATSRSACIRV